LNNSIFGAVAIVILACVGLAALMWVRARRQKGDQLKRDWESGVKENSMGSRL